MLLSARFPFRSPLRGPSAAPGGLRRRAPGAPSPTRARRPRERSAGRTSRAGLLSERCAVVLPARLSREKRQVSPEGEKKLDSLSTSLPCFSSPAQYPLSLPPRSLLRAPRIWSRGRVQVELEKAHLEGALPQVGFCFLWPVPTPKKKKNSRAPPPRLFALLFFRGRKKRKFIFFDPLKKKVTSPFFEAEARAFRFTHYFCFPPLARPISPTVSPRRILRCAEYQSAPSPRGLTPLRRGSTRLPAGARGRPTPRCLKMLRLVLLPPFPPLLSSFSSTSRSPPSPTRSCRCSTRS